jgi:hypothetical protein
MTSIEAMLALAALPEVQFMSHERKSGNDLVYTGKLYANETGWAFPEGPGAPRIHGVQTAAWIVLSEDPLVAGLRTRGADHFFASRLPEDAEYDEWVEALETAAPAESPE